MVQAEALGGSAGEALAVAARLAFAQALAWRDDLAAIAPGRRSVDSRGAAQGGVGTAA